MRSDKTTQKSNRPPLSERERRAYRLILLRRTFGYLGAGLVCSAVVGGLYRDRLHFVWGLCAAGAIIVAMGWFEYLRMTNSLPFFKKAKQKKTKTPYAWRRDKQSGGHKPAFMQRAEDFEDDLTPYTTADMELLDERRRSLALIISRVVAGAALLVISFFIPQ